MAFGDPYDSSKAIVPFTYFISRSSSLVPNEEDSSNGNLGVGPKRMGIRGLVPLSDTGARGQDRGSAVWSIVLTRIHLWAPTD